MVGGRWFFWSQRARSPDTEVTEERQRKGWRRVHRVRAPCPPWRGSRLLVLRVEGDGAGREVELADEGGGLGGAVHAVHADVLPLDGERAAVADVVEGDDDVLELHVAVAEGAEIPVAAGVAEVGVAAEDADVAVS